MTALITRLPPSAARVVAPVRPLLVLARRHWVFLFLVAAALLTRFWRLWEPSDVVFDEVHFGKFISGYFTGEYFFDIHPPLGKLIIALAGWMGGFQPGFTFKDIGQAYGDTAYLPLRAAPALFGAMLVPVIYVLVRQLGGSTKAAALGAGLVLLDNALLVESRFILLDSMLLFFGFLSLSLYLAARRQRPGSRPWAILLLLTGVALGATVSTKWTGLGMLVVVGLAAFVDLVSTARGPLRPWAWKAMGYILCLLMVPAALYSASWMVHFALLPKSGIGDDFMSFEFRASLEGSGSPSTRSLNSLEKVVEVNRNMYKTNSGIRADHPYKSDWWGWPYLPRGVSFWSKGDGDNTARIYLVGAPFLWWLVMLAGLACVLVATRLALRYRGLEPKGKRFVQSSGLLVVGVLVSWLPFAPIQRPLFLYHYFFPLLFSILLASLVFDRLWARFGHTVQLKAISIAALVLLVLGFLLFSPFSYGYSIPNDLERAWLWFP